MKRLLFVGIIAIIFVSIVIVLGTTQKEALQGFITDITIHPCQRAALDYVKSYDKSIPQESTTSENDELVLMVNKLDCYDMVTMEPKGGWYTSEFEIKLKKEWIKSFSK